MSELKEKAVKAASTFLTRKGYEVIDTEWKSEDGGAIDLVARDGDDLVFCDVQVSEDASKGMPTDSSEGSRERREIMAAKWLGANMADGDPNVAIRFDEIALLVIDGSRALLRHHINCLGSGITAGSTD
jgi:putative endonuclease